VFNETILQLFPALLSVGGVLFEDLQVQQVASINVAQHFKVDQFFAEEEFKEFPEINKIIDCNL